ncbi:WW domain-containing protein [Phthorimaea operculella]|nr:WW domain-containing protein [Phthorimaea operculella]
MALNTDAEQKSNLVLRVDQDSDSVLQSLFDTVLKPDSKRPLQVPLRMRQLPKSFFNPPSTGSKSPSVSHSRENSADSAFGSSSATGATTVSHSRAHSSPASLQQTSYDVGSHMSDDLGPLPAGWEQARTPEGQIYYLNHITKTTTWEDPRKSQAAQAMSNTVQHQSAETLLAQTPQQPITTPTTPAKSTTNNTGSDPLGPLPDGWEQAATPEGEVYFINHAARTTSWFDPRIPQHLQRTPAANAGLAGGGWANASIQACQQKLRLQSLQLERERLKQRQQEIMRQTEMMARQASSIVSSLVTSTQVANTELPIDPFLSGLTDHQRQESADSGLGMQVTQSYSMPHTPEDFLSGMDDRMDCTSEAGAALDSADMPLADNIDSTDDLLSEFTNDILLDDVQSLINSTPSKPDNVLTWL